MSTVIEDLNLLEDRILARIRELEANVAELEQLREVARRLGILQGPPRKGARATPRRGAPATEAATATTQTRRRRGGTRGRASGTRARSGGARSATRAALATPAAAQSTRRERVLEVVGVEPGISVREIVAQLGVNRTSLYPVVRKLVSDGLLYKDGTRLWPVSS